MGNNNNTMITVSNRSAGMVVYNIHDTGVRREFMPGEVKKIPYSELQMLAYQSGGRTLMENFLQIVDNEATEDLGVRTEPEYYLDDQGVIDLLKNGSLDSFLDCLDFAPIGVIDLVKQYAVSLPLDNYDKRKALKEKTGFDVDKAISNLEAEKTDTDEQITPKAPERRVKPTTEAVPTGRRVAPKYNIVKKD